MHLLFRRKQLQCGPGCMFCHTVDVIWIKLNTGEWGKKSCWRCKTGAQIHLPAEQGQKVHQDQNPPCKISKTFFVLDSFSLSGSEI